MRYETEIRIFIYPINTRFFSLDHKNKLILYFILRRQFIKNEKLISCQINRIKKCYTVMN